MSLIILSFANLSNFYLNCDIIPRMTYIERGEVLEQIIGSIRKIEIPNQAMINYHNHGIAFVPVDFSKYTGKVGTYILDLSSFKDPKHAWLRRLSLNDFDIVISDNKQTPPQQSETTEEQARRHAQLLILNEGEKEIVATVRLFDIEKGSVPYRPSLLHLPENWEALLAGVSKPSVRRFPL